MIYVMSDIHGCYDKYKEMLDKIKLGKEDVLYILGDILDRGTNGLKIALDIAKRENVILLRGNHDQQAAIYCQIFFFYRMTKCQINMHRYFQDGYQMEEIPH